jgi:hypothetical protein
MKTRPVGHAHCRPKAFRSAGRPGSGHTRPVASRACGTSAPTATSPSSNSLSRSASRARRGASGATPAEAGGNVSLPGACCPTIRRSAALRGRTSTDPIGLRPEIVRAGCCWIRQPVQMVELSTASRGEMTILWSLGAASNGGHPSNGSRRAAVVRLAPGPSRRVQWLDEGSFDHDDRLDSLRLEASHLRQDRDRGTEQLGRETRHQLPERSRSRGTASGAPRSPQLLRRVPVPEERRDRLAPQLERDYDQRPRRAAAGDHQRDPRLPRVRLPRDAPMDSALAQYPDHRHRAEFQSGRTHAPQGALAHNHQQAAAHARRCPELGPYFWKIRGACLRALGPISGRRCARRLVRARRG